MIRILLCVLLVFLISCKAGLKAGWPSIFSYISDKYPDVQQISVEEAAALPADSVLFVDVREREEYQVSRIPGALFYSDSISIQNSLNSGKKVIFYCSVGVRSSERIADLGLSNNPNVFNLKGSLFKWVNSGRVLQNDLGVTLKAHPYDDNWGVLLNKNAQYNRSKE